MFRPGSDRLVEARAVPARSGHRVVQVYSDRAFALETRVEHAAGRGDSLDKDRVVLPWASGVPTSASRSLRVDDRVHAGLRRFRDPDPEGLRQIGDPRRHPQAV